MVLLLDEEGIYFKGTFTEKSDLYAFGVTGYELITFEKPGENLRVSFFLEFIVYKVFWNAFLREISFLSYEVHECIQCYRHRETAHFTFPYRKGS